MKKELIKSVKISEGVEIERNGNEIKVKGKEGELIKKFNFENIETKKEGGKFILFHKKATKREKKMMNTLAACIKNMIKGVCEKYEYKLKICFSHFPITVDIKGKEATIKNFLGEKVPRKLTIPAGAEVKADKTHIIITSVDKEVAGQAAANFETTTRVRGRDRRVFQDGIFIIEKAGREI